MIVFELSIFCMRATSEWFEVVLQSSPVLCKLRETLILYWGTTAEFPPLSCGMWLTLTSKKWVPWMITMVTPSIYIICSSFPQPLSEISFGGDFGSQTSLLSCFRNTRNKLLLLSVSSFWRNTPEFEEAQLVHVTSLMQGGNAFLQHHTSLWSHFLYNSLEIVCDTVLVSLLSVDIYHVKRYSQLEIHSQILLPLLCRWRGQRRCRRVPSNRE